MKNHVIETVEDLHSVVGKPFPGLAEKNIDHVDGFARDFIARSPFVVLSTSDDKGRVDASPKGDAPGFVSVVDDHTVVIPDRPGNRLAYGHNNILVNPHVGLLFLIPETPETLRINGKAELTTEPALLEALAARGKPAVLAIRITVEECFFHCGKAFIRSDLWAPEKWQGRHRVSFGEMFAAQRNQDADVAASIDQAIEVDYRDNL